MIMSVVLTSSFRLLCVLLCVTASLADTECPYVSNLVRSDRRQNSGLLRIVQYNVEWLFEDYYAPMDCPGNGCTWKNKSDVETHMGHIADAISVLNPDILNLCEVEGCDELNALNNELKVRGLSDYTPYLRRGTDTSTGQNVGLLTKIDPVITLYRTEETYVYPIENSKCGYTGKLSTSGVSKHYITEIWVGESVHIALISAHLLAIPTDPARCAQREAQAMVLQSVVYSYTQRNYEVILMGDFNDYDDTIMDLNDNVPTSTVLSILKGHSGQYVGKYELNSIAEYIKKEERYSDWWDSDNNCATSSISDYSMIDHILVTPFLKANILDAFVYHGYDEFCGKYDSDHFPLVVDLMI